MTLRERRLVKKDGSILDIGLAVQIGEQGRLYGLGGGTQEVARKQIKFNKYEGGSIRRSFEYTYQLIRGIFYRVEIVKNMVPEKRRDERLL